MTEKFELSRRKVLAGLGTIGVASAGVGLGTSAYFSDVETFTNNTLLAGSLDLKVDWEEHYHLTNEQVYYQIEEDTQSSWVPGVVDEIPSYADPDEWIGFPDPTNPMVFLHEDVVETYLDRTAIEAFPDPDDDGVQELEYDGWEYDACNDGADTPEDLDPMVEQVAHRTLNQDTYDPENGVIKPLVSLEDVKPGDFGEVTFSFHLCDNPGYVWMFADNVEWAENGLTEPERKDPDEDGPEGDTVELMDAIRTVWWYDTDGDNVLDDDEEVIFRGSLKDSLDALMTDTGIPLDGDRQTAYDEIGAIGDEADPEYGIRECFDPSNTAHVGFAWYLPVDHANEIQTDSVQFDLGFYTEQCRHNDGVGMETEILGTCDITSGQGWGKQQQFQDGTVTSFARGRFGDNLDSGAWEIVLAEPDFPPTIDEANYVWTSGATVPFSYSYDGTTATFTLDGTTVSGPVPEPRGKVGVQLKADEASISVSNLILKGANGTTVESGQALGIYEDDSPDGRGLLWLVYGDSCVDTAQGFALEGDVTVQLQDDYAGTDEGVAFDVIVE